MHACFVLCCNTVINGRWFVALCDSILQGGLEPEPYDPNALDNLGPHNYCSVNQGFDFSDHSPVYCTFILQVSKEEDRAEYLAAQGLPVKKLIKSNGEVEKGALETMLAEHAASTHGSESDGDDSEEESVAPTPHFDRNQQHTLELAKALMGSGYGIQARIMKHLTLEQVSATSPLHGKCHHPLIPLFPYRAQLEALPPDLRPVMVVLRVTNIQVDYRGQMRMPRAINLLFPLPYEDGDLLPQRAKTVRYVLRCHSITRRGHCSLDMFSLFRVCFVAPAFCGLAVLTKC